MFDSDVIHTGFDNYLFDIKVRCGEFNIGPVIFFLIHAGKNGKQK